MNSTRLLAAAAIALLGQAVFTTAALAGDPAAPKTRAQVRAELEQARADGSLLAGGEGNLHARTRAKIAQYEQRTQQPADAVAARPADATRDGGS